MGGSDEGHCSDATDGHSSLGGSDRLTATEIADGDDGRLWQRKMSELIGGKNGLNTHRYSISFIYLLASK